MEQRQTLHIVGGSSRSRAEQSHLGYALGHHCEIYASTGELTEHVPDSGIILAFVAQLKFQQNQTKCLSLQNFSAKNHQQI
jgi:hypothetical protein